jgi:hypothetical protein
MYFQMGDYYLSDLYLLNLESQVDANPLTDSITVLNSIITSNVQSSNADFLITETYTLASMYIYSSNVVASNIHTNVVLANTASLSNLTFFSGLGSNLILTDVAAGIVDFYDVQTSVLTVSSNLTASNVLANYLDASTVLTSSIYFLSQILDISNVPIIDPNSKIDWASLKNIPKSDDGLDLLVLAQSAFDLASSGYDLYQSLKDLVIPKPKIPTDLKDALNNSLGDSN